MLCKVIFQKKIESNIELHELINIGIDRIIFFSYLQKRVINNYLIDNYHFM